MRPTPKIDRNYLLEVLQELVAIDSRNPTLVPGAPGERQIGSCVANILRSAGLAVELLEPQAGRTSVVGVLCGKSAEGALMLNAHMDTVGVDGMTDPFSPVVKHGKLYGRGAYDMKGSLAACIAAAKTVADNGIKLKHGLLVAAVADEEYASLGTAEVLNHYGGTIQAAIVTEPTELEICLAHKGFVWLEVETFGRAAHGSRFNEGIDANIRMGRFLTELEKLERELRSRKGHPLLGPPSLHAALISGGTGLSTYAGNCKLQIERRTIPGETADQVKNEIQAIIQHLSAADPTFNATVTPFFVREPFEVDPDASIVQSLRRAAARVLGSPPVENGRSYWMDTALIAAAGIETVVIGPAGAGAHAAEEWVDIESVEKLAEVLVVTIIDYLS